MYLVYSFKNWNILANKKKIVEFTAVSCCVFTVTSVTNGARDYYPQGTTKTTNLRIARLSAYNISKFPGTSWWALLSLREPLTSSIPEPDESIHYRYVLVL